MKRESARDHSPQATIESAKRHKNNPFLPSNEDNWLIRIGNVIFYDKWSYDSITTLAFLAPIAFWVIASIALHKLGTKDILDPSFVYPVIFGPFFISVPIIAVARRLSDKLFGNFYTERKQEWDSKTTSEHFQDALANKEYSQAKRIVIYQILTIVSMTLVGWGAGAGAFYIFVY